MRPKGRSLETYALLLGVLVVPALNTGATSRVQPSPIPYQSNRPPNIANDTNGNKNGVSQPGVAAINQPTANGEAQGVKHERSNDAYKNIFPVTMAILTLLLAVFAGLQWRAVHLQNKYIIHAQRAYVGIPTGDLLYTFPNVTFTLRIENSGNTPANDVTVLGQVELRRKEPEPSSFNAGERIPVGLMLPRSMITKFMTLPDITTDQQREIMTRDLKAYCWGTIRYRDIFGMARSTVFCFGTRTGFDGFAPCACGNEVDPQGEYYTK
jgi:hypothetical protein